MRAHILREVRARELVVQAQARKIGVRDLKSGREGDEHAAGAAVAEQRVGVAARAAENAGGELGGGEQARRLLGDEVVPLRDQAHAHVDVLEAQRGLANLAHEPIHHVVVQGEREVVPLRTTTQFTRISS